MHLPPLRRLALAGLLLAATTLLLLPRRLAAHAELVRSDPAAGAHLATAPTHLRLWFSETPQVAVTHVRIVSPDGRSVAVGGPVAIANDGIDVPVTFSSGGGDFTVEWSTAAADGHASRGHFSFSVAGPPVAASTAQPARDSGARAVARDTEAAPRGADNALVGVRAPSAAAAVGTDAIVDRWVELAAIFAVIGAVIFRLAVLPVAAAPSSPLVISQQLCRELADRARRLALGSLLLVAAAALWRVAAESVALGATSVFTGHTMRALVLETAWGRGWLVGVLGIVISIIGLSLARSNGIVAWWIAAIGALGLALGVPLTGHPAAEPLWAAAVPLMTLHVVATSSWLGTLLVLLLVGVASTIPAELDGRRVVVRALVEAFTPVALASAGVVVVTGAAVATLHLGGVRPLFESEYGRILLLKLFAFAGAGALGFANWRRVRPTLGDADGAERLRRTATAELVCGALVLALTAVLASTPIPITQTHAPAATMSGSGE